MFIKFPGQFHHQRVSLCWILQLIFILFTSLFSTINGYVPRELFFPYGVGQGDGLLPPGDDTATIVNIKYPLPFYGQKFSQLWVNVNGILTLGQGLGGQYHPVCNAPTSVPYIAPYWADADLRYTGKVYFREVELGDRALDMGYKEIIKRYPNTVGMKLQWGFVATWEDVTFFDSFNYCGISPEDTSIRNTFQAGVFHDGIYSYTVFQYEKITWTTGTGVPPGSTADCLGIGFPLGPFAKVGINSGIGLHFEIPISCTPDVVNIEPTSNYPIGEPGKYVLILDENAGVPPCTDFRPESSNLRIRPPFVDPFGHFPITVQGPCLTGIDEGSLNCIFIMSDISLTKSVVAERISEDTAKCILPYLSLKGPINVNLELKRGGVLSTYHGTVYSISPETQLDLAFDSNTGEVFVDIEWDKSLFNDDSAKLSLIQLKSIDFQLREVMFSKTGMDNTGFYNGIVNIGVIDPYTTYAFRLTPEPISDNQKSIFSWLQNFPYITPQENRVACYVWAGKDNLKGRPQGLISCPPLQAQAEVDERFYQHFNQAGLDIYHPGATFGVRQRSTATLSTSECIYASGQLKREPKTGGYCSRYGQQFSFGFGPHYDEDVAAWYLCCEYSASIPTCQSYYNQRPMDNGLTYEPPASAKCGGDPHLTTFDSLDYTFNGAGEFTMIRSPQFKMQCRMEPYQFDNGSLAQATVFTACVMLQTNGVSSTKLQVNSAAGGLEIYINDEFIEPGDPSYPPYPIIIGFSNSAGELVLTSPSQVNVIWSSGFTFVFTTSDGGKALNVLSSVEKLLYGSVSGLYGWFDGDDGSNDLQAPDGTTIPSSSSLETIHYDFGNKWKISAADSLFRYARGKSWASYDLPDFLPTFAFPDPTNFPPEVREICGTSQNCLFDYGTTGSIAVANDTKALELKYIATVEALNLEVKLCPPILFENGYFTDTNYYFPGSLLTFVCDENYTLSGPSVIKCVERGSGRFVWSRNPPTCVLCPGHDHENLLALKAGNHSCGHGHGPPHHTHDTNSEYKPYRLKFPRGRKF